jgi:signal transduction histidine kinase
VTTEDEVAATLARALRALFPGRLHAIRLLDPRTLAVTTLHARGALRPHAGERLSLRRGAVARAGLSAAALAGRGVALLARDEPLFAAGDRATAVPLVAGGELLGIVNLEYASRRPGDPREDEALLRRLVNHAAVGVRAVRSLAEVSRLKTDLENLIEHAGTLILAVDRNGAVTVWNRALVALTGRAAAAGAPLAERVIAADGPLLAEALRSCWAGKAARGVPLRLLRAGGAERADVPVAFNLAPVRGPGGEVETVLAVGQDQTPLRSAQAAAEHAERLAGIGRLVAGVVHELANPLTAVTMYAESLLEKATRGGETGDAERLRAILEGGQRIQRLSRDLLAYARPGGGAAEPVDLGAAVDEGLRLARPALKASGALLERVPGTARVVANRAGLVQLVVALVTNAAQAVPQGGHIRVAVEPAGREVRLVVADDGAGMADEVRARAFEPFFTTRGSTGIGLGLPIVREIVERLGGRVGLESAPGQGTTVSVAIPSA